ncbi:MAG: class I SAM-dependent RNA methyltransferase [Peptostreptococcaceae bacterium]|nr:class I SAM-dependent RNA methyltransferase [Peptostreptococcaceae bacterium]
MMMEAIAVCLFGMESTISYELKNLGFQVLKVSDGRVTFSADELGIAKANISLRCAERVLVKVGEFPAKSFEELFDRLAELPFEKYLQVRSRFSIAKVRSINSKLVSASDIQSISKKAIVERLKKIYHVQWFEESEGDHRIHLFINKDIVEVSFDTTGPALHKRGYRELSGEAPLRETIAAFMVMLSPWRYDRILVDPMCGSGTIAIEAAMYGANIMPGVDRNFAGEELTFISKKAWVQARKAAIEGERDVEFQIRAFDKDRRVIELAKENAALAGVDHLIRFSVGDATKFRSEEEYGFIISNPPYGERMGKKEEIELLYKKLGKAFKSLPTWSIYLITGLPEAEKLLGMKIEKKRKLYNGSLRSNIYIMPGPKPPRVKVGIE